MTLNLLKRRRLYDKHAFQWHIGLVDEEIPLRSEKTTNPAKHSAIFIVHGMGEQQPEETAAAFRSGFDNALLKIQAWQAKNNSAPLPTDYVVPPPYIMDGYWANYTKVDETFVKDWERFDKGQKTFFQKLWQARTQSRFKSLWWVFVQLLKLLNPLVIFRLGLLSWVLYLPYQVTAATTLLFSLIKAPIILTGFLGDLRLYFSPKGVTERAIVQRIDQCVAERLMKLFGMDCDFNSIDETKWYKSEQRPIKFSRVVWVSHSLGTVISYNVLSDLFQRADEIERTYQQDKDALQQQYSNVQIFRRSLRRFVTLGSPLDKVAFLFGEKSLSPWPTRERACLLEGGEESSSGDWWINFYCVLDPVSGALNSKFLCGGRPPVNYHTFCSWIPGYAHVGYWRDGEVLRYILGRTYGKAMLPDRDMRPCPVLLLTIAAFGFHVLNFLLAALLLAAVVWLVMWSVGTYHGSPMLWFKTIITSLWGPK